MLIAEIEESIARGSLERRALSLRRVTDLFLRDAAVLTDEQIELFDLVIARLAAAIETRARAELSERLADAPNAPRGVLRSLAHDEIVVARPVLSRSERLSDDDLVAVALAQGRDHMLAISERPALAEPVTDVLVSRGDRVVVHAVAANPGARFSDGSITSLVDRARADEALQTLLHQRRDLPENHIVQLLAVAKETARRRLAEGLPERTPAALNAAVERSATRLEAALVSDGRDYGRALEAVQALADARTLTEADLAAFAQQGSTEEAICAQALLAGLSVPAAERAFCARDSDLLLVVGKSQGWSWRTMAAVLKLRDAAEATPPRLKRASETYEQLSAATAQRVMHFLKVRESAQKQVAEAAARRQIRTRRG